MSTDLTLPPPAALVEPPKSIDLWLSETAADPLAAEQLLANAVTHAETKKRRHADRTKVSYDYWWGRLDDWCRFPNKRIRGRALPEATPAMALDPTDSRGLHVLLIFLYELVHGPEDPHARALWAEDFGPVAPSTLSLIMSALKARCTDHLGHKLTLTAEVEDALRGLRRIARRAYGKDRRATPILAGHLSTMIRYLAGADDPLIARDRLLLELTAVGVTSAEIARLRTDSLLVPAPGLIATTHEANEKLWATTGEVGARALLVPGRVLGGGRQAASRIITLPAGHPLASAIDAWLIHRLSDDDALIDGVGSSNPRSIHRAAIRALAADAATEGCTWNLTSETPVPGDADLEACRRTLARRAQGDLALRQRDTAALWIGWRIALRRSELMALTVGDVVMAADRALVTITESKTDQDMKGITLPVTNSSRTDGLDPIGDIRTWLETLARIHGFNRAEELPSDTPLFPALGRGQEILTRVVTRTDDGSRELRRYDRLSDQGWSDRLRLLAERSGAITDAALLVRVTGHSLRRGYITSAAIAGRTAVQIRRVSRHVEMNSLARYVEEVQAQWDDDPGDFEMLVSDSTRELAAPVTLDARIMGGGVTAAGGAE